MGWLFNPISLALHSRLFGLREIDREWVFVAPMLERKIRTWSTTSRERSLEITVVGESNALIDSEEEGFAISVDDGNFNPPVVQA
ncbi:hypothetical protein F8388_009585 [Cannabis sativa]|uniref:Uncharacterized protein n=1 Tax=Cannabis sativa TaxID=3483 RepID=A0A7J6E8J2_CANSA|nr:hypothetical protein F8388_009585 [Cannabis sativa]